MGFADVAVDFPAHTIVECQSRIDLVIVLDEACHVDCAEILVDVSCDAVAEKHIAAAAAILRATLTQQEVREGEEFKFAATWTRIG